MSINDPMGIGQDMSLDDRIAQAMAQLEATKAAVAKAEQELRSSSTVVRSRDRAVEVTVGPQGELQALKFLGGKYQSMGAAQLAASVLEAANQGRAVMARRVVSAFGSLGGSSGSAAEVPGFDTDWQKIFGSLLSDEAQSGARGKGAAAAPRGRKPAARAAKRPRTTLQDEITEDPEDGTDG